jgi:hypothetical protein
MILSGCARIGGMFSLSSCRSYHADKSVGFVQGGSDCRDPLVVFVVLPVVILPHAPVQPHESPCCNTHSSRMPYLFPFLFRLVLREF